MKTKICLALSTLIITSLMAPPIMGMGEEKAQGESQVTKFEARHEHLKEVTAGRIRAREESRAAKDALIALRHEHLKEVTTGRIRAREEYRAAKNSQVSLPSTGNVQ